MGVMQVKSSYLLHETRPCLHMFLRASFFVYVSSKAANTGTKLRHLSHRTTSGKHVTAPLIFLQSKHCRRLSDFLLQHRQTRMRRINSVIVYCKVLQSLSRWQRSKSWLDGQTISMEMRWLQRRH